MLFSLHKMDAALERSMTTGLFFLFFFFFFFLRFVSRVGVVVVLQTVALKSMVRFCC
jgi:hypothetical protein